MKVKSLLFSAFMFCMMHAHAQDSMNRRYHTVESGRDTLHLHHWYRMYAWEAIFSGGRVVSDGMTLDNVVRFSLFFDVQEQFHYNFNNTFGMFTGIGIRNVGFINEIPVTPGSDATVKQRSYSLGIPLALKIGNMSKGDYLALGAEAELMFAYKEKISYNDQKYKNYSWFSDNVNTINPSVFADIRFHTGGYIRFKYYLLDFLKDKDMSFYPPESLTYVHYQPASSKMFYVAIGTAFRGRKLKKRHATQSEV